MKRPSLKRSPGERLAGGVIRYRPENRPDPITCPMCEQETNAGYGSQVQGSCWWECECGSYSPLRATWAEAAIAWRVDPQFMSARPQFMSSVKMEPPVGG